MSKIRYAGLGSRIAALAVDLLLFCLIFFPITKLVKGVWIMSRSDHLWGYGWLVTDPLCVSFLVVIVIYFIVSEGVWGATLGKLTLGLRVITPDGHKPGLSKAAVRNALRVVDSLPAFSVLGAVLILTSRERTRFGDRVAGTRVVNVRSGSSNDN